MSRWKKIYILNFIYFLLCEFTLCFFYESNSFVKCFFKQPAPVAAADMKELLALVAAEPEAAADMKELPALVAAEPEATADMKE